MKLKLIFLISTVLSLFLSQSCEKKEERKPEGILQLSSVRVGTSYLKLNETVADIPVDDSFIIEFNAALDSSVVKRNIILKSEDNDEQLSFDIEYIDNFETVIIIPTLPLNNLTNYVLQILSGFKGKNGETFPGTEYRFTTVNGEVTIESISLNDIEFKEGSPPRDIDYSNVNIEVNFSHEIDPSNYQSFFVISGNMTYSLSEENKMVTIAANNLDYYKRHFFTISENLTAKNGFIFKGFSGSFYTALDSSLKFPLITDEELLTLVQQQTFKYFWDFAHPVSGLARERNTSGDVVTIGGSGFGVMAIIVGIERNFITRSEGIERLEKILGFLETCDRYHGAWPHWLNGATGKTIPFSPRDDGGDLVETSYMIQGLLTFRQYLDSSNGEENLLIQRIDAIVQEVEYDFFTRGENVLYWHWSPNNEWAINLKIEGYNETLISYVLAASSKLHGITPDVYKLGYTRNGAITNGDEYYGYKLPLGYDFGGPLFFAHYSFLGLDPRNLKDELADYWEQNVNHSLINWAYCTDNPKNYIGYNSHSWGLTASDNPWGYNAHSPTNDLGVITPSAAVSSIPYTPEQSMNAIKHFYYILGDRLWGEYGFFDAFNVTEGWWAESYLAIDQGPIICMIENYRTGLLWNLFMSNQDVRDGLTKLGFTY